jgi:hypothetical protein
MNTQQFNADMGFKNQNQAMNSLQQSIGNRMQGFNMMNSSNQMNDSTYAQMMGLLNSPNSNNWNNMNNYANIIQGGARMGGTQTTQTPYYQNNAGNALGMGLGMMNQFSGLFGGGGGSPTYSNFNPGDRVAPIDGSTFGNFQMPNFNFFG